MTRTESARSPRATSPCFSISTPSKMVQDFVLLDGWRCTPFRIPCSLPLQPAVPRTCCLISVDELGSAAMELAGATAEASSTLDLIPGRARDISYDLNGDARIVKRRPLTDNNSRTFDSQGFRACVSRQRCGSPRSARTQQRVSVHILSCGDNTKWTLFLNQREKHWRHKKSGQLLAFSFFILQALARCNHFVSSLHDFLGSDDLLPFIRSRFLFPFSFLQIILLR